MSERETFLDRLRVLATCAVVMLHTVTGVMDHTDMGAYPLEKKGFLVVLDLVCWCVPVFLLISGYLFLNPDRKLTFGKMLTKYCRRIVLALFGFGVPYACLEQIAVERCFRWDMVGKSFLMVLRGESWSHLWYLYLILILYLLTPVVRRLLAFLPGLVIYMLLAVLFIGSSLLPYLLKLTGLENIPVLPDWGIYFFYYICGGLFRHRMRRSSNLLFMAAILAAAMVISRLPGNYTVQMAYNYPFTVILSLLLFAGVNTACLASDPVHRKSDIFWKQAAKLSFTVYLVHPLFLNIAYKFLHITPLSFFVGISLPFFWGTTLLLSVGTAWLLFKIPFLRRYIL